MIQALADKLARKDFFTSLGIWIALEMVAFVILPILGLSQPGDKFQQWFYASFPFGIVGAVLIGWGSRLVIVASNVSTGFTRFLRVLLGNGISLLGVIGIAFPLLIGSIEVFATLFNDL